MDIKDLRERIEEIDRSILELLERRMELALMTRAFKKKIFDGERERKIKNKIKSLPFNCLSYSFIEEFLELILKESKRLQKEQENIVGFQGEHGAFSEIAFKLTEEGISLPFPDFGSLFEAAEKGVVKKIIVPVENFSAGSINETNYLLLKSSLKIEKEIVMKISHYLLAPEGIEEDEIKFVYSHPQALSQCRNYLSRKNLLVKPFYDTAGAARMIATEKPPNSAAIASRLCAQIYGLKIIDSSIEDSPLNKTRFFLLSKEGKPEGEKASFTFSLPNRPGALKEILEIFADREVNLSRIHSLPVGEEQIRYYFFIEAEMDSGEEKAEEILEILREKTINFKFLGFYKTVEVQV